MEEISRALDEMRQAATPQARTRADTQFHLAILRAAGNELLVPLGVLVEQAFNHLFTHVAREGEALDNALKLHAAVERNIRLQRPDAARNAVRKLLADTDAIVGRVR
jgi:DNA-binding FadR family transcriptional regulator